MRNLMFATLLASTFACSSKKGPVTVSQFERSNAKRIERLDPVIMTADVYQRSGQLGPLIPGVPFTLKGGAKVSISRDANDAEYRVTYWPQENRPPTAEQKAGQPTTTPLPPK